MDLKLKDKVVLITGATGGLGQAITKAFYDEGAKLAVTSTSQEKVEKLIGDLGNPTEDRIKGFVLDVTKEEDVEKVIKSAYEHFGAINVLVPNAGYDGQNINVVNAEKENYEKVFAINFYGVLWTLKYTLPYILENETGSVVAVGSSASYVGSPGMSAYIASKHALAGLIKSVAREVGPQGVHVNFVAPSAINTDMMRRIEQNTFGDTKTQQEAMEIIAAGALNKRYAEPVEVASTILYLASDYASHIMGYGIRIDGGKHIY